MTTIAHSASMAPSSATGPVFAAIAGGHRAQGRLPLGVCGRVVLGASVAAWAGIIYATSLLL